MCVRRTTTNKNPQMTQRATLNRINPQSEIRNPKFSQETTS